MPLPYPTATPTLPSQNKQRQRQKHLRALRAHKQGIRILAPMFDVRRKNDKEAEKDITKQNRPALVGFRSTYVFDVAMTEGAPLPELADRVSGTVGEYRSPKEKRPGTVQRGHFHEIDPATDNPDAEPVPSCASAKPAIIVYGRNVGSTLTVCTDEDCPVHDPNAEQKRQAAAEEVRQSETNAPEHAPPAEPTEEEKQELEERRRERERQDEERRLANEQRQREYEAEQTRRTELQNTRNATFERIVANAPPTFNARQMRIFLRALVNLDPYTFAQDVAEHFAGEDENNDQTPETILLDIIDGLGDHQLTGLALRLAFTGHTGIPRESEIDFLAEADAAFAPQTQPKAAPARKEKKPTPIKASAKKKAARSKSKAA